MSRYIYDWKSVISGRKSKWCSACGMTIPIGASSITVTYYNGGEFMAAHVCNNICLNLYKENFDKEDEDYEEVIYEDGERDSEFE